MGASKKRSKQVLPVTSAITFLGFLDTHLLIPVIALYASSVGASMGMVGLIVGLYSIINTPANIVFGRLIDRVGYKAPLIGGLIGDVFSIRIAGNFVNEDILGSMEFATKVIGSKHILVLGHTSCGAIQGAKDQVELGNLTGLVNKLQPAVEVLRKSNPDGDLNINHIAEANVRLTVEEIQRRSPILKEMLNRNEISISGAMYDVATGKVEFLQ